MTSQDKQSQAEKKKIIDSALSRIRKQYGDGAIMRLGEKAKKEIEVLPTGCLSLDLAIGIGGLPKGRIVEIYGPESSGKTTFALGAVASCQRLGGTAAFIDAEHALDPVYAKKLGVDTENLIISQPDNGEQALEIVDSLISSGSVDLIVVDSVAALVPQSELDGDMNQQSMGTQARLMSKALRKITGSISRTGCVVIFINQIRMKIGVMFGSPETTTGGNALKFYASVRIDIRRSTSITKNEVVLGAVTKVKIVKNKMAPPFRSFAVDLMYGEGIERVSEIISIAEAAGILEKAGSWYSYKSERLAQGKENLKDVLRSNTALLDELEQKVRATSEVKFDSDVGSNSTED